MSAGIPSEHLAHSPSHDLALRIDHTLLRADATSQDIRQLCAEAKTHGFYAVCVHPVYVALCHSLLMGTDTRVTTVCAFPHGALLTSQKATEAQQSVTMGADEIDMVLNIAAVLTHDWDTVQRDIAAVRAVTEGRTLKVILETGLLGHEEKRGACRAAVQAGADFVKTSTGFAGSGATVEDVQLMLDATEGRAQVKASGGIRTTQDAYALLKAGATRLGTSAGVQLVTAVPT